MKHFFNLFSTAVLLGTLVLSPAFVGAQDVKPVGVATCNPTQNLDENGALPRATPESVGVPSQALAELIQTLDAKFNRMDSLMVLRDGKVIAECWRAPNSADAPHAMYSLSKSFTSTAIGFAVQEGKLSIDQKVVDIFPDDLPAEPSENLKKMTLADLLSMSCGHETEVALPNMVRATYGLEKQYIKPGEPTWVQAFLAHPVPREPGTHFRYNTPGTYMLSAALQKTVGETTRDYLVPRLFEPLRIETPYWEKSPEGITKGGTGLYLRTEDIAKFGQLYLQRGRWNDKQILSADWVDLATSYKVSNGSNPDSDWAQGYCFQFWRCRKNIYRGDGAYVQFCVVMPDQNVVVAMTSDGNDYQGQLNTLYDILLPALQNEALPENADAVAKLRETEKSLQPKEGTSGSEVREQILYSEALKREVKCRIYLPNEYRTTSFSYPVLYLLHGMGGNEKNWSDPKQGNIQKIADEWFAKNPTKKAIIVMPDAQSCWYRDSADDSCKYETFFFDELIPAIETFYRCKTGKENRSIAGLSMGGYGSLLYALRRPDMFSACFAMSPAIRTQEEVAAAPFKEFISRYRKASSVDENAERLDDYFFANDPHTLVKKLPDDAKKSIRFCLDCGDDDYLTPGAHAFHNEAKAAGVACEYRVRDGAHNWKYWRESAPLAFEFIWQTLAK